MLDFLKDTAYVFTNDPDAHQFHTAEKELGRCKGRPSGHGFIHDPGLKDMEKQQQAADAKNESCIKSKAQGNPGKARNPVQGKTQHFS